jgi:succinate dehydrogenase/fumarate reductase flavoprotein subunit
MAEDDLKKIYDESKGIKKTPKLKQETRTKINDSSVLKANTEADKSELFNSLLKDVDNKISK